MFLSRPSASVSLQPSRNFSVLKTGVKEKHTITGNNKPFPCLVVTWCRHTFCLVLSHLPPQRSRTVVGKDSPLYQGFGGRVSPFLPKIKRGNPSGRSSDGRNQASQRRETHTACKVSEINKRRYGIRIAQEGLGKKLYTVDVADRGGATTSPDGHAGLWQLLA